MDTIPISVACFYAGDSRFRLSSRKDKGQAPTLSFTYNPDSELIFLNLDGDFTYSRTGYYPESNSLELFLSPKNAAMLCGVLKNVVAYTSDLGKKPESPEQKSDLKFQPPKILREYTIQTRAISIVHPLGLSLKPRTNQGFTTYVALTHLPETDGDLQDVVFRIKFWLTEKSIPELEMLQKVFRQGYETRTQLVHVTFTFNSSELSLLQRQLEVLKDFYLQMM